MEGEDDFASKDRFSHLAYVIFTLILVGKYRVIQRCWCRMQLVMVERDFFPLFSV